MACSNNHSDIHGVIFYGSICHFNGVIVKQSDTGRMLFLKKVHLFCILAYHGKASLLCISVIHTNKLYIFLVSKSKRESIPYEFGPWKS